jgi:hypothetical protein
MGSSVMRPGQAARPTNLLHAGRHPIKYINVPASVATGAGASFAAAGVLVCLDPAAAFHRPKADGQGKHPNGPTAFARPHLLRRHQVCL